jgi:hypothetical protein
MTVTLHDDEGALLLTLVARERDGVIDAPLKNLEGVQPAGGEVQGIFGDGLYRVGVLERELALCGLATTYSGSRRAAKAALDTALADTFSIRVDGYELALAGVQGISEWGPVLDGIRARIRFIPSTPYWVSVTDPTDTAVGLL